MRRAAIALVSLAMVGASGSAAALDRECSKLRDQRLARASIVAADEIAGGSFVAPGDVPVDVPRFCRVQADARPSSDSHIRFELWMPASGWNGRYYQLGNGGYAGSIPYASLAAELRRGNAVAATDTGHTGGPFDAAWALGHPEKIIDYGWRSLKETFDGAQVLIRAHYGTSASHRYFNGCSNGGRQALMLAQRFPADWDGILAGAPALNWTAQLASFAVIQHALRNEPDGWIEPAKLPAIQRAALASCASAARLRDGIPQDPRHCAFDPASLLCKGEETNECLTGKQAATLVLIQRGFEPTAAAVTDNWDRWIVNADRAAPSQLTLGEEFFRNMVFADATWRLEDFDPERDLALTHSTRVAGAPLSRILNATSSDLAPLERRGAKVLMYFGWADALISPRAGLAYYEEVIRQTGSVEKAQAFFRLFMVPGMTHCQDGPGPNVFGQSAITPGLRDEAAYDIRRALEAWVERGVAPERVVAVKYIDDDAARGVARTGELCPFPQAECGAHDEGGT